MKIVDFKTFKTVQRMSLNQFNRWVESIYRSGFEDGLREGEKEFNDCVLLTEDELRKRIIDVSGIGERRAEKAVENILEGKYETD